MRLALHSYHLGAGLNRLAYLTGPQQSWHPQHLVHRGVLATLTRSQGTVAAEMSEDTPLYQHGLRSLSKESNPKGTAAEFAKRMTGHKLQPLTGSSNFVKPGSVLYSMDGRQRRWDVVEAHSSVGVILYHTQLQALILVRQFRPAVYASFLREEGQAPALTRCFSHELCAGLIDKDKSLEEIASEEVLEECGFRVPASQLSPVITYTGAVGIMGTQHYMFVAEVDDSMRVTSGGGLVDSGEAIEVLALPLQQAASFLADTSVCKSAGLCYGLQWLCVKKGFPS